MYALLYGAYTVTRVEESAIRVERVSLMHYWMCICMYSYSQHPY